MSQGTAIPITEGPSGSTWVKDMDYGPSWSPDGKRIAFTHDPDGPNGIGNCDAGPTTGCTTGGPTPGTIYLVNPDGSGKTAFGVGSWPAFRPLSP